jgi:hypothetical protein
VYSLDCRRDATEQELYRALGSYGIDGLPTLSRKIRRVQSPYRALFRGIGLKAKTVGFHPINTSSTLVSRISR